MAKIPLDQFTLAFNSAVAKAGVTGLLWDNTKC